MTADRDLPSIHVDVDVEAAPAQPAGLPPEWMVWAAAIERQEDLRHRVTRGTERGRYTDALAQHTADGGDLDWTEETLDFVSQLRQGTSRPELHSTRRRWSINRRAAGEASA